MNKITNFTQIKEIIEPIPAYKFIVDDYGDNYGSCCFLGHIHKALSTQKPTKKRILGGLLTVNIKDYIGDRNGFGARQLTAKFLKEKHGLRNSDGAQVNNTRSVNGYNQLLIKDRLMHMINDAIKAGY